MLRRSGYIFGGTDLISSDSVKARLKNQAIKSGRLFQEE